jgi:hypothetical protein
VADVPAIEYYILKQTWLVTARVHNYVPNLLFSGNPLGKVTLSAR